MSVRHLIKQPILCCRQLRASPTPPLRLLPVFPTINTLVPIHRRSYADLGRNPRGTDIRKITDKIRYIDAEGNYQGVQFLWYVLVTIDREKYHLVCVNPHVTEEPPTCKAISKEQLRAEYLARKAKGNKNPNKVTKTVEISWATAQNDLGHKIRKITEFLQKGNKVGIILGVKKGMAKQPLSKMEEMVKQIREQAEQFGREWKGAEGMVGVQYLIYFEGRRPKVVENPVEGAKVVGGNLVEGAKVTEENPVEEAKVAEENPVDGAKVAGGNLVEGANVTEENPVEEAKVAEENPVDGAKVAGGNLVEGAKVTEENPVEEAKVAEENPVEEAEISEENPVEEAGVVEENSVEETKVVEEKKEE